MISLDARSSVAFKFSRRCKADEVPGISTILGERPSSHVGATCNGVAFSREKEHRSSELGDDELTC